MLIVSSSLSPAFSYPKYADAAEVLLMWINRYGIEMVPTFRHRGYAKWLHRGMVAGHSSGRRWNNG
jgi:hypothetical protein